MLGIAATFSPSLKQVFRSKLLGLAAFGIAGMVFLFSVYLPNFRLIRQVVFSKHLAMADKAGFLISLLGSIQTNFTAISATATVLLSILFGVNAAMTLYYVIQRKRASAGRETAAGLGGLVAGVFGIGCAACGSVILTSFAASVGASGLLAFLPLAGGEFAIAGVLLLVVSLAIIAKKIQDPLVCETPAAKQ